MIMTIPFSHRLLSLAASCLVTTLLACASSARAQTVVTVNGESISDYDIDQRAKLNFLTMHKPSSRNDVINELIDEKVKIKEARKYGVDPTDGDIEQAYERMAGRMRITGDQLTKSLEGQGIRPDTLKARIRANMAWVSLVRKRYKDRLEHSRLHQTGGYRLVTQRLESERLLQRS